MSTAKPSIPARSVHPASTVVLDCGFGSPEEAYIEGTAEKGAQINVGLKDKPRCILNISVFNIKANRGEFGTADFHGTGYQVDVVNGDPIPGSSCDLSLTFVDQHLSITGNVSGETVNLTNIAHNAVGNPVRYI